MFSFRGHEFECWCGDGDISVSLLALLFFSYEWLDFSLQTQNKFFLCKFDTFEYMKNQSRECYFNTKEFVYNIENLETNIKFKNFCVFVLILCAKQILIQKREISRGKHSNSSKSNV